MNTKLGKDEAITNAIKWTDGVSFSDGNIIVGQSADHICVAWNNSTHNQNQLTIMTQKDAATLYALLTAAGRSQGWLA